MADANITIEDAVDAKIIHISGQLDESNVDEKIKEVYKIVEANPKNLHLIFDLENLDYLNSKAIGYLTDLYGKVTGDGGKIATAKAKTNILDILQVVGLTQLIQNFDTVELAKASFGSAPAAPAAPAPAPQAPTPAPQTPAAPAPVPTPAPAPAPVEDPAKAATSPETFNIQ
ncbi:MAG: STAS domain-containing protein [Candidatus Gracilibacteria bacterium]